MKKSVRTAVYLIGLYVALQLIADISAVKQVNLWGLVLPGGSLVFALTFTVRDAIHKRLGEHWAKVAIDVAAVMNILMAGYLWLIAKIPAPVWWQGQAAYEATLVVLPRIAIASIIAEWISERTDTVLYSLFVRRFAGRYQWGRVVFSNAISAPVDSIIFGTLAFAGIFDLPHLVQLVVGQVIFKWLIGIVSIPGIYLVSEKEESLAQPCCD